MSHSLPSKKVSVTLMSSVVSGNAPGSYITLTVVVSQACFSSTRLSLRCISVKCVGIVTVTLEVYVVPLNEYETVALHCPIAFIVKEHSQFLNATLVTVTTLLSLDITLITSAAFSALLGE